MKMISQIQWIRPMSRRNDGPDAEPASTMQHGHQTGSMTGEHKGLGKFDFRKRAPLTGSIGLLVWIVIFGMGCLVDSTPYRIVNDPTFRRQILLKADKSGQDSEIDPQIVKQARELDSVRNIHVWTRFTRRKFPVRQMGHERKRVLQNNRRRPSGVKIGYFT